MYRNLKFVNIYAYLTHVIGAFGLNHDASLKIQLERKSILRCKQSKKLISVSHDLTFTGMYMHV